MSEREPEISQQAIAHELGDKTIRRLDYGRGAVAEDAIHIRHLLGVEAHSHGRRVDKVAEHDRQLTALRRVCDLPKCNAARHESSPRLPGQYRTFASLWRGRLTIWSGLRRGADRHIRRHVRVARTFPSIGRAHPGILSRQ